MEDIDSSSGLLIPFLDTDTNVVYVAGKVCRMSHYHQIRPFLGALEIFWLWTIHCIWKKVTPRHHTIEISNLNESESEKNFVGVIPNKLLK